MLTLAVFVSVAALLAGGFVWFTRTIWFHRDPEHSQTEQDDNVMLSPVYGIVSYIRRIKGGIVNSEKAGEEIPISDITKESWPPEFPEGDGWLVGIAMTALDVHFQYSPVRATLLTTQHHGTGRNLALFDLWEYARITWFRRAVQLWARKHLFENERQTMWLDGERVKLALVLIADKFVDKIKTFASAGDPVPAGGKLSFIGRGSQVDVVICGQPGLELLVKEGDSVSGPKTVLARLR